MSQTKLGLTLKGERESMINWLSEPISDTDIYFDIASKYYEDLMETINAGGNGNIRIIGNQDYFKIKFLHLLHKHSNTK
jgi:hypothetical protein